MNLSQDQIEFLEKKAALEILNELGKGPKRHSTVRDELLVSTSTFSRRLKEGVQLGLWQAELRDPDDGPSYKVYALTECGEKIFQTMKDYGLDQYQEARRELIRRQREIRAEAIEDIEAQTQTAATAE